MENIKEIVEQSKEDKIKEQNRIRAKRRYDKAKEEIRYQAKKVQKELLNSIILNQDVEVDKAHIPNPLETV